MVDQTGKTSVSFVEHVNNFDVVDLSNTGSEFSSFAQNFLSSTEVSAIVETHTRSRPLICPFFLGGGFKGSTCRSLK